VINELEKSGPVAKAGWQMKVERAATKDKVGRRTVRDKHSVSESNKLARLIVLRI
jgi:hypothetical protein